MEGLLHAFIVVGPVLGNVGQRDETFPVGFGRGEFLVELTVGEEVKEVDHLGPDEVEPRELIAQKPVFVAELFNELLVNGSAFINDGGLVAILRHVARHSGLCLQFSDVSGQHLEVAKLTSVGTEQAGVPFLCDVLHDTYGFSELGVTVNKMRQVRVVKSEIELHVKP